MDHGQSEKGSGREREREELIWFGLVFVVGTFHLMLPDLIHAVVCQDHVRSIPFHFSLFFIVLCGGKKEGRRSRKGKREETKDALTRFLLFFREERPSSPAPKTEIVFDQRRTLWVLGCRICTSQCKIPSLPRRTNEPKTDLDLFPFLSYSQLRPHLLGRRREPSGTCLVACSRGKGDG